MLQKRTFFLGVSLIALLVCSFMAGSVSAQQTAIPGRPLGQQQFPGETVAPYGFPRTWGGLHSVTASSNGFAYFFVAPDGTVRAVEANLGSIVQIHVIPPR
jgi:uncharacterized BrkB/YihY/UPF0761 family membrane protein